MPTSASSKTTTGEWPPSSIVQRFTVSAASFSRCLPTAVDPVNETLRGMSEASTWPDTSAGTPNTKFRTPAGRPASWKQRASPTAVPGVSSLGLMSTEQPAAIAPAIFLITLEAGKFQAAKPQVGPTGSFMTIWRRPGTRAGTTRP